MNRLLGLFSRFGIRARLLTLLLPGVVGLLVLDSLNDYRAERALVQNTFDSAMLESVSILQSSMAVAPDGSLKINAPFLLQTMIDSNRAQHKHVHVGVTPRDGAGQAAREVTLLGDAVLPLPPRSPTPEARSVGPSAVAYDAMVDSEPSRIVALRTQVQDGGGKPFDLLIQLAESTAPRDEALAASLRQQLIRDVRMVLVTVLLVWLGILWSLQPLEKLRRSVLKSKGHELKPLDTSDVPHEVAPLVDAVNIHVASYRELLDQQSQFLADASHQLRTPLAIMLTQAGVALREKNPDVMRETLRAMVAQISRSRRLCEQLLSLAHASDGVEPSDAPALVDLNAIARDVVLQYLSLAHEKNQDLGWVDARENDARADAGGIAVPVMANGLELHEVLSNLVHNAIVYTPLGGNITVMTSIGNGRAMAEVRDDGPGISEERRVEVFERFHHGGTSLAKSTHGAGLGLSIARAYARRNGGDIELVTVDKSDANKRAGLRAILTLPLSDNASSASSI